MRAHPRAGRTRGPLCPWCRCTWQPPPRGVHWGAHRCPAAGSLACGLCFLPRTPVGLREVAASAAPASGRGAVQVTFFSTEEKFTCPALGSPGPPDRAPGRASRRARPGPIASSRPGLRPGRWGRPVLRIGRPVAPAGGRGRDRSCHNVNFAAPSNNPRGPPQNHFFKGGGPGPGGGLGLRPFKRVFEG